MKPIDKDELYENLTGFLKNRGVEIKEGTTKGIQTGCTLLAEAINLSQTGIELARAEIEKKLDQMRQVIHESTAPKRPPAERPQSTGRNRQASAPGKTSNNQGSRSKTRAKAKSSASKAGKRRS